MADDRDYKQEYRNYQGLKEQLKRRAQRNRARRLLTRLGRVQPGDGKDVDHKDHNPFNAGLRNLRVLRQATNRSDNK